jgi:hypothetical protein
MADNDDTQGCGCLIAILMGTGALIGYGIDGTLQGASLGAGLGVLIPIVVFFLS